MALRPSPPPAGRLCSVPCLPGTLPSACCLQGLAPDSERPKRGSQWAQQVNISSFHPLRIRDDLPLGEASGHFSLSWEDPQWIEHPTGRERSLAPRLVLRGCSHLGMNRYVAAPFQLLSEPPSQLPCQVGQSHCPCTAEVSSSWLFRGWALGPRHRKHP